MIEQSAYRGFGYPIVETPTHLSLPDQREQKRTEDSEGRMREQRRKQRRWGLNTRGGSWALGCCLAASLALGVFEF